MTPEEVKAKIEQYNQEIKRLFNERRKFMNDSIPVVAVAQVGDKIYRSGRMLGIVTGLRRYQHSHDEYDTSLSVIYEYKNPWSEYKQHTAIGDYICNEDDHNQSKEAQDKADYLRLKAKFETGAVSGDDEL